MSGETQFYSVY